MDWQLNTENGKAYVGWCTWLNMYETNRWETMLQYTPECIEDCLAWHRQPNQQSQKD